MNSFLYLLDTNILSDLVRNPAGPVFRRIKNVGEETICTSIVVAAELRFGACKKGSQLLTERVEAILSRLEILALESPTDSHYAELRLALEKAGTPIGPNDMLIAAHALALNCTLITANTSEFSRVPNLKVDNWLL